MASQAKTIEAKKDEFRAYLEKTGVVDQLTKVLVSLYEETDKPNNPLEFIKKNMSAPEEVDEDNLKNEYLKLKDENYNIEIEEEKIITNNITNKILSFSNKNKKLEEETEEELNKINELMKKKENREIFLTKLNGFRNLGLFLIPEKKYYEIGKIMNSILDHILEDEDLYCAKNVMILSQTYYINDKNNKKKYLQLLIQINPIFKNIDFWKKYVQYSIVYEIKENLKKEIKTGTIIMNNQEQNEMKYNNIVFGQLVPIANNMIEFGLDKEKIKEIIQEKFESYRISEDLRKIILDIIEK
jgi:hypothetical protein